MIKFTQLSIIAVFGLINLIILSIPKSIEGMKRIYPFLSKKLFLSLLLLLTIYTVNGQEKEASIDSIPKNISAFELGEVADESEKLGQKLIKLKSVFNRSEKIFEIDSIVTESYPEIIDLIDSTFLERKDVTLRDLKVRKVEWVNYKNVLTTYQETVRDRTKEITDILSDTQYDLKRWRVTKKELGDRSESKDIRDGFDAAISSLENVILSANNRLDSVFITQKKITDLTLIVDEEISNIDLASVQRQKDYFVFDSNPIWSGRIENDITGEGIDADEISSTSLILKGLRDNKNQFFDFFHLNIKTVFIQIAFIILLFVFLLSASQR